MRGAFEHIGDGLDAAMWVHREAADGTLDRIVEGKVIKKQEGIKFVADPRRNGAAQFHARALDGGLWFNYFGDRSKVVHACMDAVRRQSITGIFLVILKMPRGLNVILPQGRRD